MKSKCFLLVVILLFVPVSFLAAGAWQYNYLITNESEQNIFFTAHFNNFVKENGYIEYIHQYMDGGKEHKTLLPIPWPHKDISEHVSPNKDVMEFAHIITISAPIPLREDVEYISIDGYDILRIFFDEFIVYDDDGNIILTMDDLQRGVSFRPFDETLKYANATVVFHVTKEMVESGRRKYTGRKYTPEGNDKN
jgi:hypothetical protein